MGQDQQLRRMASSRKSAKTPPIFSQEFIIQNHADIMSCVAMVFVAGLMFQISAPLASMFVVLQHNVTDLIPQVKENVWLYKGGFKDFATMFFYTIICIVVHAVVQEYGVDKLQRKVHLSKTKTSKFNESGQLLVFSLFSTILAGYIISHEGLLSDIRLLWDNYPANHTVMGFLLKLYFIAQIAYWLHTFPEFYFQKTKREEIRTRSFYAVLHLLFIVAAYGLNFTRVALCILFLHYAAETIFHFCRIVHFAEKSAIAETGFKVWNVVFVLVRLCSAALAVLAFWYGLRTSETPHIDLTTGNFNTTFIRLNCLLAVCLLQVWMMWNFVNFHLKRVRERSAQQKTRYTPMKTAKKKAKKLEGEVRKFSEADQDATRALRSKLRTKMQSVTQSPDMKYARNRLEDLLSSMKKTATTPTKYDSDGDENDDNSSLWNALGTQSRTPKKDADEPALKVSRPCGKKILFELRQKPFELPSTTADYSLFELCRIWLKGKEQSGANPSLEDASNSTKPMGRNFPSSKIIEKMPVVALNDLQLPKRPSGSPSHVKNREDDVELDISDKAAILAFYLPRWKAAKRRVNQRSNEWAQKAYGKNLALLEEAFVPMSQAPPQ